MRVRTAGPGRIWEEPAQTGSYWRMPSGICSRSVGMNCDSSVRLWTNWIFLLNFSLRTTERHAEFRVS